MKQPILFLLLSILSVASALAQGGPPSPPGEGGEPGGVNDNIVPIDDHIWILILVAIIIGVYILKSQKAQTSK